jgi:hypothetical protein
MEGNPCSRNGKTASSRCRLPVLAAGAWADRDVSDIEVDANLLGPSGRSQPSPRGVPGMATQLRLGRVERGRVRVLMGERNGDG